ncbi:MAG: hypothetical protein RSE29_02755 [Leclercia sp.]
MGVRQDGDGNFVNDAKPWESHETYSKAQIAETKHQEYLDSFSPPQQAPYKPLDFESSLAINRFIGVILLFCVSWAVAFGLILIPGLNSAGMLVYQGGILAVPGGIFWFVLKTVYSILTAPMMVASVIDPFDPGTHLMWQAITMAVVSLIIYKFRRKVRKPILYVLGFLALIAYISIGIVALNDNLWAQFKMFPYL